MAEKIKSGKNQYKTLRAYLVYDYIFKKTEGDMFTTTQINEYLQLFGIECDNRSIVRDIEALKALDFKRFLGVVSRRGSPR